MKLKWMFSVPTTNEALYNAEKYYQIIFPKEYKEIVLQYNRATAIPSPCCIYVSGKERVFVRLLSINTEDRMNIYNFSEIVDTNKKGKIIAFGEDPFGNYWCFDYSNNSVEPNIVFWDHEEAYTNPGYNPDFICDSFLDFLGSFQEPQE